MIFLFKIGCHYFWPELINSPSKKYPTYYLDEIPLKFNFYLFLQPVKLIGPSLKRNWNYGVSPK